MSLGQNTYQLTMGTIGGYVLVYDMRYSLVATQMKHSLDSPVLALSQINLRQNDNTDGECLLSTTHALSPLNLETGTLKHLHSTEVEKTHFSQTNVKNDINFTMRD